MMRDRDAHILSVFDPACKTAGRSREELLRGEDLGHVCGAIGLSRSRTLCHHGACAEGLAKTPAAWAVVMREPEAGNIFLVNSDNRSAIREEFLTDRDLEIERPTPQYPRPLALTGLAARCARQRVSLSQNKPRPPSDVDPKPADLSNPSRDFSFECLSGRPPQTGDRQGRSSSRSA